VVHKTCSPFLTLKPLQSTTIFATTLLMWMIEFF